MALKQLIKTQMKWRKKTQKCVEIATATKIRINVIEKKNVRNCGFLLDQYARGRVLTQVPQAHERGSLFIFCHVTGLFCLPTVSVQSHRLHQEVYKLSFYEFPKPVKVKFRQATWP